MNLKKTVKQMVIEAEKQIKVYSILEAKGRLDDDNYIFIDLRDTHELDKDGMVSGAIHAPRGMIEFWIDPESPFHKEVFASNKTFIFYCKSGWRSALATKTAQDMGLSPVVHIDGGFAAWMEADFPIEKLNKKLQFGN
jgi:rhodanese-related sulfurtransferase